MKSVAIIGAGPSGFYVAQQLLKSNFKVSIFERRLVPYGLVRYGIAPDHQSAKQVESKFQSIAENCNYIGNISIPIDLDLKNITQNYNAVVYAYGMQNDRKLNIPNEDANNVLSAREFVGWYNGDPEFYDAVPNLESHDTACIIGVGNVALDCARILLSGVDNLRKTDISSKALDILSKSRIKHLNLIGRRGVLDAAFTSKEARELLSLHDIQFRYDESMVRDIQSASDQLAGDRVKRRLMSILMDGTKSAKAGSKSWGLSFYSTPESISVNQSNDFTGLSILKRIERQYIPSGTLIKSIGYTSSPFIPQVPFNESNGTIPNNKGRVMLLDGTQFESDACKHYCSGWIKTGPKGVIASTMYDAYETARSIIDDLSTEKEYSKPGYQGIQNLIPGKATSFEDWKIINRKEIERGRILGKPREKFITTEELLQALMIAYTQKLDFKLRNSLAASIYY